MNIERETRVATPGQRVCLRRSWREMFGMRGRADISLAKAHATDIILTWKSVLHNGKYIGC